MLRVPNPRELWTVFPLHYGPDERMDRWYAAQVGVNVNDGLNYVLHLGTRMRLWLEWPRNTIPPYIHCGSIIGVRTVLVSLSRTITRRYWDITYPYDIATNNTTEAHKSPEAFLADNHIPRKVASIQKLMEKRSLVVWRDRIFNSIC